MPQDDDWSCEEDQILLALRDEFPRRTYERISFELRRRGFHRTREACIGRFDRIMAESEAALAAALRAETVREIRNRRRVDPPFTMPRDPYEPRPDFFVVPTPVDKRIMARDAAPANPEPVPDVVPAPAAAKPRAPQKIRCRTG